MRQGTTPKHTFTLPFDTALIKTVQVTYKQGEAIVLQKETADFTREGQSISCKLTQEETFKFNPQKVVQIQVRVLTTSGDALASDIIQTSAPACLDDEVLT